MSKSTEGMILNISRNCTDDGPGIRTTVFLKGCPLSCEWCHNPESQKKDPEILYHAPSCKNCGKCAAVCPGHCHENTGGGHIFHRNACTGCGKCAEVCAAGALQLYGKKVTVEELLPEVLSDSIFFDTSGGGVTLSGGEPLFQADFSAGLLSECKKAGVHTCMETSGAGSKEALEKVLSYCDLVLFDIKETDPEKHLRFTGWLLSQILSNLHFIDEKKVPTLLRLPVIPGRNDRPEHFATVQKLASSLSFCTGTQIMPYHALGAYKYTQLQRGYACSDVAEPDDAKKESWQEMLRVQERCM